MKLKSHSFLLTRVVAVLLIVWFLLNHFQFVLLEPNNGVIAVSSNKSYAYLQAVIAGPKSMNIGGKRARELHYLDWLQGDFVKFLVDFDLLGKLLDHAQVNYEGAEKRLAEASRGRRADSALCSFIATV